MRCGVLGGTFDPPHRGHLTLARRCREALALEEVLFVPAFQPPHKLGLPVTPYALRLEMLQAAVAEEPRYRVLTLEREAGGISYTVRTLAALRAARPGDEIWLLLGEDSLADLPHWREPERIAALARLAVYRRHGAASAADARYAGSVTFVEGPYVDIASHEIRERVQAGLPIDAFVPPGVRAIVAREGLYREPRD